MEPTIRTYETFDIVWEHSTWTGYQSAAEAQAVVDFAWARSGRVGYVARRTFEVTVRPEHAHLYRPGIAERVA